jgi:glycine cleavage system aminomethyltransferase T
MSANPLIATFEQNGAELQAYDQIPIVSTFGEPEAEYAAIRKAAALIDQPQRGFLELKGADRLLFLNNFFTQQVFDKGKKSGLAAGEGAYGFVLKRDGRILADANVIERGDSTLLEIDGRLATSLKAALEKYIFTEKVTVTDRSDALHQIALYGPKSLDVLKASAEMPLPELTPLGSARRCAGSAGLSPHRRPGFGENDLGRIAGQVGSIGGARPARPPAGGVGRVQCDPHRERPAPFRDRFR